MPSKTFDGRGGPPNELGKFTKIPGGKSQDMGADQARPDEAAAPARQAMPQQSMGRDPKALHDLGFHATVGYGASARAVDALHSSGDLQAMHHHGRALQESVKALKLHGAKPEEIERLRHGLTSLHSALTRNDRVGAHEAINNLRHGFYHAHAVFQKEFGPGGFPVIGRGSQGAPAGGQAQQAGQGNPKAPQPAQSKQAKPKPQDQGANPGKVAMRAQEWAPSTMPDPAAVGSAAAVQSQHPSPVVVNLHTAPVTNNPADSISQFKDVLVEAMRATKPVQVNVPPTQVHVQNKVDPTPVRVENKVEPTPVKFEATVEQPKAPDVHVHVNPTPVTVEAKPGEVTVKLPERKPRDIKFETDKDGKLTGASMK